ncbi:DUF1918 domain-containing protein [Streptomyces griseoincarnatus]
MAGLTARSQGYAPVEPCGGVPPVARWIQHHSEERAAVMRAHPGDRPVVGSPATGVVGRDGGLVGPHHDDGTPPYDVRRPDTDGITLVFPGPDAYIRHIDRPAFGRRTPQARAPRGSPPGVPAPPRGQAAHAMTGRRSRPRTSRASASLPPTSRHTRAPVREGWPR